MLDYVTESFASPSKLVHKEISEVRRTMPFADQSVNEGTYICICGYERKFWIYGHILAGNLHHIHWVDPMSYYCIVVHIISQNCVSSLEYLINCCSWTSIIELSPVRRQIYCFSLAHFNRSVLQSSHFREICSEPISVGIVVKDYIPSTGTSICGQSKADIRRM